MRVGGWGPSCDEQPGMRRKDQEHAGPCVPVRVGATTGGIREEGAAGRGWAWARVPASGAGVLSVCACVRAGCRREPSSSVLHLSHVGGGGGGGEFVGGQQHQQQQQQQEQLHVCVRFH